ncbi:MAG: hypothetical protein MJD61_03325 [Proteobacteria bacterium]|nr:hypothetical protein [Pseudomonadota bacterium]
MGLNQIHARRDRVSQTLQPYLGSTLARERANNIAQAMVLGSDDAAEVARVMLSRCPVPDVGAVAEEVGRAWRMGEYRDQH